MIEEPLNLINDDKTSDKVVIDFHCKKSIEKNSLNRLCGTLESRKQLLEKSSFALIIFGGTEISPDFSSVFQRITEALESGAIPVFLCLPDCQNFRLFLPFQETIDWTKFSIFLPAVRVTEAHFLLRSFPDTGNFN